MNNNKKNLVVLSGAGISAESGVKTFRDADGLWEGHDIMEVASPQGWHKNPELVLEFYNQRRRQLKTVFPNKAHNIIANLEKNFNVFVVTQNVDNLHERAGSSNIIHLHGELNKVRSTRNPSTILEWNEDCNLGDKCSDGFQLRPHIVWFGEAVPMLEKAAILIRKSDIVIIVGTSLQVYPAAGLIDFAPKNADVYYIDPKPSSNWELENVSNLTIIKEVATIGLTAVKELLLG